MSSIEKTNSDDKPVVGNNEEAPETDIDGAQEELKQRSLRQLAESGRGQRLNFPPALRVVLAGTVAGGYGLITGFYRGFTRTSLQYLAENAHRMPSTKGGWYFYHKRKNYVVLRGGLVQGFKQMARFGGIASVYFGLEAYIDRLRGVIDFGSSALAAGTVGLGYGVMSGMSKRQTLRSARTFMLIGGVMGIFQDCIRYKRGYSLWYLKGVNKKEMPL